MKTRYPSAHPLINLALAAAQETAYQYQGVRKIINGFTWQMTNLPRLEFADLGYGSNKFKQLVRNYVNEEEFARVRSVLERRRDQSFTSVALAMRGAKKESRSQGWCMLSIVVTVSKRSTGVEVQYRSTELTLKFGGDLVFLRWLFQQLKIDPDWVTFRFANCYLSGVYLPYLVSFADDPVTLLQEIKKHDEEFFQHGTRFFLRSSYTQAQVFPYSPENVAHKFLWSKFSDPAIREIRDYLEKEHKRYGKPLPKTHYKPGEYIPRGQRKTEDEE